MRNSYDVNSLLAADRQMTEEPMLGSRRPLILWLVALGLMLLFVPLYLVDRATQAEAANLETELSQIQLAQATGPTPDPTVLALQTRIAETQAEASHLQGVQAGLGAQQVDWPAVIGAISQTGTNPIAILGLAQTENRLVISGEAGDDTAVIAYAQQLEASGQFQRVVVQSITLLPTPEPVFTPTPTATLTVPPSPTTAATAPAATTVPGGSLPTAVVPTAAPPTATPNPRDIYEPDDFQAGPIFVGEVQTRNFHPAYDIDSAYFLAKNGRFYTVATTNLSPGVDTVLTVTIGDQVFSNDDRQDGTLASEIGLQSNGGDVQVFIQVTNRGQYGPNMAYQLYVQEVVGTAVPTALPTGTATATAPPPTDQPPPTNTPDLRDAYEPDEATPAPIVIGETQARNFFPQGDEDHVSFLAKGGRFYQVATAELALGVDTFLWVELEGSQWENDDYALPGTGNFASSVCFPATAVDGTALAHVSNKIQQYAPHLTYNLSVLEVPALNLDRDELAFGPVPANGENPPPQTILVSGDGSLGWNATTDVPWLQISPNQGGASAWVNVTANVAGLPQGSYTGTITFNWASLCYRKVTVTLQVDAPVAGGVGGDTETAVTLVQRAIVAKQVAQPPRNTVAFVIVVELRSP